MRTTARRRLSLRLIDSFLVAAFLVVSGLNATPAQADEATDYEFYARWGVSGLTQDRQTNNRVYVHDITQIGTRVYVAGNFLNVVKRGHRDQPIPQSFLAAFDAASGAFIPSFRPVLDHPAYTVMEHPTTHAVVVGGEFTKVNGMTRRGIVALNPVTGATDPSFATQVFGTSDQRGMVKGIATNGSRIFVGGSFNGGGDGTRILHQHNLLKVGLKGGIYLGWRHDVTGGGIWDVAVSTDRKRVIAAGRFDAVDGHARPGLAMLTGPNPGTLHPAFAHWNAVGAYCFPRYPGCLLNYDIDVDGGELAVAGAEHYVAVFDDTTGERKWVLRESNDTQAVMFQGNDLWLSRHGRSQPNGLYYARDRHTSGYTVSTFAQTPGSGPGGFAFAPGVNGCVWFGGAVGALDLADVPGSGKAEANHLGFMCPAGTSVPAG